MVIDTAYTWGDDRSPRTPWNKTFIYELHVKGFTKRMPGVPEPLQGTYAGLASEAAIDHLKSLNVTAVELLPTYHRLDDKFLLDKGLVNYWGYNTLSYFAPDLRYASARSPEKSVEEFKTRELMLEREKELREKGHRPDRSTESVPVTWEMRWRLTYSPEMRKRKSK